MTKAKRSYPMAVFLIIGIIVISIVLYNNLNHHDNMVYDLKSVDLSNFSDEGYYENYNKDKLDSPASPALLVMRGYTFRDLNKVKYIYFLLGCFADDDCMFATIDLSCSDPEPKFFGISKENMSKSEVLNNVHKIIKDGCDYKRVIQ